MNDIGLQFVGLPSDVADVVGCFPKKPNFYGQAQRRKLWECRDAFSFTFNPPCLESLSSPSTQASTTSTCTSASRTYSVPLHSSNTSPGTTVSMLIPLTSPVSTSTTSAYVTTSTTSPLALSTTASLTSRRRHP